MQRKRTPGASSATIKVTCPRCKSKQKVPKSIAGTATRCPVCQHEWHITGGSPQDATPPPSPRDTEPVPGLASSARIAAVKPPNEQGGKTTTDDKSAGTDEQILSLLVKHDKRESDKQKVEAIAAVIALPLIGLVIWWLWWPSDSTSTDPSERSSFERIGYLKHNDNRIFTIAYKAGTPESEIRAHAEGLPYTDRRVMAVYYYPEGSKIPADGITLAAGIFEANEVLYETPGLSPWRYAYMRSFSGKTEFVDCQRNPDHSLSRKK